MELVRRVPVLAWFLLITLVVLIAGVFFFTKNPSLTKEEDPTKPQAVSKPVEGTEDFAIVGRGHITDGTPGSGYNSNPPSSGPHWQAPAKAGIYDSPLPDERFIHNLEHGHIWIAYKNDVGDEVKNKLKGIVENENFKIVLAPRDANETKIALVAWGRVLKMQELDEQKVRDFIRTYRNRGPENTPE